MFSPGGFDATLANWTLVQHLRAAAAARPPARPYTCVLFDRRESGASGGRRRADHLGGLRAPGQGPARPPRHRPGPPDGRLRRAARLAAAFARRATRSGTRPWCCTRPRAAPGTGSRSTPGSRGTWPTPREHGRGRRGRPRPVLRPGLHRRTPGSGPGPAVIRGDPASRTRYARPGPADATRRWWRAWPGTLFDRDTVPGPEPEDLLRLDVPALIVPGPGRVARHRPPPGTCRSACRGAQYWDVPVSGQTEETAPAARPGVPGRSDPGSAVTSPASQRRGSSPRSIAAICSRRSWCAAALERGGEPEGRDRSPPEPGRRSSPRG